MPKFYTAYDPPPPVNEANLDSDGNLMPSCTQQHFAEECDINNIVNKYMQTGVFGDPFSDASNPPQFGDFYNVSDFHSAQNLIAEATQSFDALPAHLRKRFDNDPSVLLAFLEDESNREEAEKLGLVTITTTAHQHVTASGGEPNSSASGGTTEGK